MAQIVLFDTLLRDGCQSADVTLSIRDKLEIVKALDEFGIDYIELGWPAANEKEMETFQEAHKLNLQHAKIVAFGSTRRKDSEAKNDPNLQGIVASKATVACIFGKTWLQHIEKQLKTTPEKNKEAIHDSITFLRQQNLDVFYDLEHFFDGYKDNPQYALDCIKTASRAGASYVVPCDTNGGTLPEEVQITLQEVIDFIKKESLNCKLGVHFHNDCGVGVANSLLALSLGATMVQGTINGFGERTGNADLCQIIPNIVLKKNISLPSINLKNLTQLSTLVYTLANIKHAREKPFVGKNAFSHKGGIHVDAINKGASYEHIDPKKVGNKRDVILSDLSGKANILETLKKHNISVEKNDPRVHAMLKSLETLEKKGFDIGTVEAEQFLLVQKHFGSKEHNITIDNWSTTSKKDTQEYSEAEITATVNGTPKTEKREVQGGPVDALFHALKSIIESTKDPIDMKLVNYKVAIAKDQGVESSVRVYIEFQSNRSEWGNIGVSTNILEASLEAITKGFLYYLLQQEE